MVARTAANSSSHWRSVKLDEAQEQRRQRLIGAQDHSDEDFLNRIGLTEELCTQLAIGPQARQKLKGIIGRLRKLPHPFTQCMRDLKKHKPEWSEDRRKRTCQTLKVAAGRAKASSGTALAESPCVALGEDEFKLLEHIDLDELAIIYEGRVDLAVMSAKARKQLKPSDFVFPKERRYPIQDLAHARNALARASGKPEEATVKAAVYKRYPELRPQKKAA